MAGEKKKELEAQVKRLRKKVESLESQNIALFSLVFSLMDTHPDGKHLLMAIEENTQKTFETRHLSAEVLDEVSKSFLEAIRHLHRKH